jgi:hypothetical protein
LGRRDSNLCISKSEAELHPASTGFRHRSGAPLIRDAQVRVPPPGLRVLANSDSNMQRFESRRPSQPVRLHGVQIKSSTLGRAIVAVARRLAVIMHRMWVDGTESAGPGKKLRRHDRENYGATVPSMHTCDVTRQKKREFRRRWSDVPAGTMDEASPFRILMPAVSLTARTRREIGPPHPPGPIMEGPSADPEEKRAPCE